MFVLALFSTGWFSWTPEATGALAVALRVGAVAAVAVAVAGGVRKLDAIRGALAGGYVRCLVTDRRTAEVLLSHRASPTE